MSAYILLQLTLLETVLFSARRAVRHGVISYMRDVAFAEMSSLPPLTVVFNPFCRGQVADIVLAHTGRQAFALLVSSSLPALCCFSKELHFLRFAPQPRLCSLAVTILCCV